MYTSINILIQTYIYTLIYAYILLYIYIFIDIICILYIYLYIYFYTLFVREYIYIQYIYIYIYNIYTYIYNIYIFIYLFIYLQTYIHYLFGPTKLINNLARFFGQRILSCSTGLPVLAPVPSGVCVPAQSAGLRCQIQLRSFGELKAMITYRSLYNMIVPTGGQTNVQLSLF